MTPNFKELLTNFITEIPRPSRLITYRYVSNLQGFRFAADVYRPTNPHGHFLAKFEKGEIIEFKGYEIFRECRMDLEFKRQEFSKQGLRLTHQAEHCFTVQIYETQNQ